MKLSEHVLVSLLKLRDDVEKSPNDFQYERIVRFGCGVSSIVDALRRLGIAVKKTLNHPK